MHILVTIYVVFIAALMVSSTQAWWNNGHMITARVAYDYIYKINPEILRKIEMTLEPLKHMNKNEDFHIFVESATFADDIKVKGMGFQSPWHYIDLPYMDNYTTTVPKENFNVTWSINYMAQNLKKPKTNEDTGVSWSFGDAFNLRLLIHYTGDVHQPLHTTSRFAKEFPHGDMGGNLFKLKEMHNVTNLHALWDSTIYEWDQDFKQPLGEADWVKIGQISEELAKENPADQMMSELKVPES